jgi:hypothetical protein
VVEAGATVVDILRDCRLGASGFEQLELRFPDRNEMGTNALTQHLLGRFDLQPERVAVEGKCRGEISHGDAHMVQNGPHEFGELVIW